jgi:hypothetical protein
MLAAGWDTVVDPGCEAEKLMDVGERVVVRWRGWGKGRGSGIPVDWREAHTYARRDGKVVEVREYRTWQKALEAAGLRESRQSGLRTGAESRPLCLNSR